MRKATTRFMYSTWIHAGLSSIRALTWISTATSSRVPRARTPWRLSAGRALTSESDPTMGEHSSHIVFAECIYDWDLKGGDVILFGREEIMVIATPRHTPGSVCYLWRDRAFSGDTLSIGGVGEPIS